MAWHTVTVDGWAGFQRFVDAVYRETDIGRITLLYRGQADAAWANLQPSLTRLLVGTDVKTALEIERAALAEFQSQAGLHLPPNLLSRTTDITGWWSLMQHYRAPTRLLDWTASPYVAAYFAVGDSGAGDGVIWYFAPGHLEQRMTERHGEGIRFDGVGTTPHDANRVVTDYFMSDSPPSRLFATKRREKEERMIAQQGVFTVSRNPLDDHARVIDEALEGHGPGGTYGRLVIPREEKKEFLGRLRFMNIAANSLFPGIDGIGISVSELIRVRKTSEIAPQSESILDAFTVAT